MRGFWADERIEGAIWNKNSIIGASLYAYFKKKEKEMIIASDAIISLTHKAKQIIIDWNLIINNDKIISRCIEFSKVDFHKMILNVCLTLCPI